MPMTGLRECIAEIAARLAAAGVENARGEAWLLLGAATGLERATLAAGALPTLAAEQEAALEALVRRRQSREPIAYILGRADAVELEVTDEQVVAVLAAQERYYEAIGAFGPQVSGPADPATS
mgnify:CR=1 FL=1